MPFELLENFERLLPDQTINNQTASNGQVWKTAGSGSVNQEFKVVLFDGKKVLWCNPSYQNRAHLPLNTAFSAGRTGTLFFRIRYSSKAISFFYVGLTTQAIPEAGAPMISYVTETGPLASANEDSDKYRMEVNTWYKVWMIVDLADPDNGQMDNSFRVYFQNEATGVMTQMVDAAQAGRARTDFIPWSYMRGSAMPTFLIFAGYSAPFHLDDIYVDTTNENLTDPTKGGASPMLTLVNKDRTSEYDIVCYVTNNNRFTTYEAALILQEYIQKATDTTLKIVQERNTAGKHIYVVGQQADLTALGIETAGLDTSPYSSETYILCVKGDNLILGGLDGPGKPWDIKVGFGWINTPSMHAVSKFLQDYMGVRWYWPGKEKVEGGGGKYFGENYSDLRNSRLYAPRSLNIREDPSFSIRDIQLPMSGFPSDTDESKMQMRNARWLRLNRLGVRDRIWHTHYWHKLMPMSSYKGKDGIWTINPDGTKTDKYYAFFNPSTYEANPWNTVGRVRGGNEPINDGTNDAGMYNQLCVSGRDTNKGEGTAEADNKYDIRTRVYEAVLRQVTDKEQPENNPTLSAVPIAPNDGGHHCACDPCLAQDVYNGQVDTNAPNNRNIGRRMFRFFNEVTKRVTAIYPDLWLTTYAYAEYRLPPELKGNEQYNPTFLHPKLIVFCEHNGYAFRYHDAWQPNTTANERAYAAYRLERWGTTTRDADGKEAGHTALFCGPYYYAPFINTIFSVPVASAEPLIDMIARLKFHRFMGAYFEMHYSPGHWPDRYLAARLLAELQPPAADAKLEDYLAQAKKQAQTILDNYYNGLFGKAGPQVKSFYQEISDRIKEFVQTETKGQPLSEASKKWSQGLLFDRVFAPFRQTARSLLAQAASTVKDDVMATAHLALVQMHWQFVELTIDFFNYLDQYSFLPVSECIYTDEQVELCRSLWRIMTERSKLVDTINLMPDLCTIVISPGAVSREYSGFLAPKSLNSKGEPKQLSMPAVSKIVQSIPAMRDVDPRAVRMGTSGLHLRWEVAAGESSDSKPWVEWFISVDPATNKSKSYIVIVNNKEVQNGLTLQIRNMDTKMQSRSLQYFDFKNRRWTDGKQEEIGLNYQKSVAGTKTEYFEVLKDSSYHNEESAVVTDKVTFNAQLGVTVLLLQDANFAPHYGGSIAALYYYNPSDKTASVPQTQFSLSKDDLGNVTFKIFHVDDAFLLVKDYTWLPNAGGRFYITKDNDPSFTETWVDVRGYKNPDPTYYDEAIESVRYDENKPTTHLGTVIKTEGTYKVYAAVYDCHGLKQVSRDGAGNFAYITLKITP